VKAALYDSAQQDDLLLSLTVAQVGDSSGRLKITQPSGSVLLETPVDLADSAGALDKMFVWLGEHGFLEELAAAGHRLVQGGLHHKAPERISPPFMVDIEQLVPLDPDHLPAAIRGIQFVANKFPELPQVACSTLRSTVRFRKMLGCMRCLANFTKRVSSATGFTACPTSTSCRSYSHLRKGVLRDG
jgi:acetate kinase